MRPPALITVLGIAGIVAFAVIARSQNLPVPAGQPTPGSYRRSSPGEINPFASEKSQRILNMLSERSAAREEAQRDRASTALDDAADRNMRRARSQEFEDRLKGALDDPGSGKTGPAKTGPTAFSGGKSSSGGGSSSSKKSGGEKKDPEKGGTSGGPRRLSGKGKVPYCNMDLAAEASIDVSGGTFSVEATGRTKKECPESGSGCCFDPPVTARVLISGKYQGTADSGVLAGNCRDTVKDAEEESRFRRKVTGSLRNGVLYINLEADQKDEIDSMRWTVRVE